MQVYYFGQSLRNWTFHHEYCIIVHMLRSVQDDIKELGPLVGPGLSDLTPVKRRAFRLSTELPVRADVDFYPDRTSWDADVHQEFEFGIVLAGTEERRLGLPLATSNDHSPDSEQLGPGDVWLGAMWEPHWWRAVDPGTSNVFVHFRAEYLGTERVGKYSWFELFAPAPDERPRVLSPVLRKATLSLGDRMRAELEKREEGWEWAIRLDLLRVLVELARQWNIPVSLAVQDRARDNDLHRIIPALVRVNSYLPNRISLQDAAGSCGMSRTLFCVTFKRSMGVSFTRFLLRARLAWVSSQLLSGDDPIASIAAEAGFSDESHLHRTFLKQYGCTPGHYRHANGHRENDS